MKINNRSLGIGLMAFLCVAMTGYGQIVTNGDFENWGTIDPGPPPTGTPTGWTQNTGGGSSYVDTIQGEGLVTGSTYSAIIQAGNYTNYSGLIQSVSGPADFTLSMVLATGAVTSDRSFQLYIDQSAMAQVFNLRLAAGSSTTSMSLQAHNGSTWVTLAADAFQASTFNAEGDGFDTLYAYNFILTAYLDDPSPYYSISYGLVGSSLTTLTDLTAFWKTPVVGSSVSNLSFYAYASRGSYAIDNVSLTAAVPEPAVASLLLGGLGVFVAYSRRARRERAART